jgi:hypothetical protein
MSFERCVSDPALLARLMTELDTPMDKNRSLGIARFDRCEVRTIAGADNGDQHTGSSV